MRRGRQRRVPAAPDRRGTRRRWLASCLVAAAIAVPAAPAPVGAHDVDVTQVARVFLDELEPGRYLLSVVDAQAPPIPDLGAVVPTRCAPVDDDERALRVAYGFVFECDGPLGASDTLTLPWSLAGVVVIASWSDGSSTNAYFRGDGRWISVPLRSLQAGLGSGLNVAGTYAIIGAEHILLGIDHLLFVLGLLLLVRGFGPLVKTITAFTVAHSITLGVSVLGFIPLDRAPIEAAIALSIVLLAREIAVADRGLTHLTHRKPWLVAFIFGLLHGLGFAGALGDIGLPEQSIPLALLFFNIGVELGQLAFVLVLLVAARALRSVGSVRMRSWRPVLGYGLGALATLWFFERLPGVWGG